MIKELCTTRFYFLKKIILYILSSFIWVASILSEKSMFIDQRYGYCNRESSTYFLPVVFLMVMAMLLSEYRSCITTAANNYANVGIGTRYVVYTLRSWIIFSEGKMCWRGWSWSFTIQPHYLTINIFLHPKWKCLDRFCSIFFC